MALWKHKYALLSQDQESKNETEHDELEQEKHTDQPRGSKQTSLLPLLYTIISVLLITNIIQTVLLSRTWLEQGPSSLLNGGPQMTDTVSRLTSTWTPYTSTNQTEADEAWDAIEPGHGVIALDRAFAAKQKMLPSSDHPRDPDKVIYVIEAYHAMHCLKVIREHYNAALSLPSSSSSTDSSSTAHSWPWNVPHDMHCIDTLRQHIMCQADSTLLASTGHRDAGHHQVRQCKDWDALREWASERTACYEDLDLRNGPKDGKETRWGHCDGGDDGLPRGGVLMR